MSSSNGGPAIQQTGNRIQVTLDRDTGSVLAGGIPAPIVTTTINQNGQVVPATASNPVFMASQSGGGYNFGKKSKRYAQRLINAPAFGAFDTTSFRWIEAVPFTGKKFVRVKYENDTTTAFVGTMTTAVAGGRAFADTNPVNASGANPTWVVSSGLAVPAADASVATNGKYGTAWTPWMLVDFPPATDGGYGSYLYIGMKLSTGTGRGLARNASQQFEQWETILSAGSTRQKSRRCYQSGGDFVSTNQNGMNAPIGGSAGSFFSPAVEFEIMDVQNSLTVYSVGDSTRGGQGTTAFNWNWMNQWADSRVSAGMPISCVNLGFAGKPGSYYMGYLQNMLTDGSPLPDWLVLQPFSANTGSEAGIQTDLQTAFALAESFEAKGTVVTMSTVGPAVNWFGASSANEAVRLYGNTMIRNSSRPYIDLDAVVTDGVSPIAAIKAAYTPDGNHYNDLACGLIAAQAVAPISKQLFGI
ncbi:MAG: SGNH/GDSL hydrolase family protein [Burkholderiales bacterium]|nr:SGNH/GDSL hydrolase family protein [Burkholderiales bacterium]